ncbi:MAG: hypothetical protein AAFR96_12375 [Planctomycetota bacterium]
MRRLVDLVAILAVGCVIAAWFVTRDTQTPDDQIASTKLEIDRLRAAVLLRSQSDRHSLNTQGWPIAIDPAWFGDDLPLNPLVDADRPWLEVAARDQSGWEHPRPLFTIDRASAMFWYNPALGIVRARVPMQTTDGETLRLYNTINNASLSSINPATFGDLDAIDLTSIDIENDPAND